MVWFFCLFCRGDVWMFVRKDKVFGMLGILGVLFICNGGEIGIWILGVIVDLMDFEFVLFDYFGIFLCGVYDISLYEECEVFLKIFLCFFRWLCVFRG